LEGTTVMLGFDPEDQKGEPEREVFRIVKFQKEKPDSLTLADVVLHVQLFNAKYGSFFKATFDDAAKVVRDHKVPMIVVIETLEDILAGKANNVVLAYDKDDGKQVLLIKKTTEYKMFSSVVVFEFKYIFQKAKMSFEEEMNMKLTVMEQNINGPSVENDYINNPKFFITGKEVDDAKFDASRNNYNIVQDNGKTLARNGGTSSWNTTPVTTEMSTTQSYRARFRVANMKCTFLMFGVVSSSFSVYTSHPTGNGQWGWMAYVNSCRLQSHYTQNGSFTAPGICVFAGCIVTVEYYPKHGIIHYFVNNNPAAKHYNCTFNNGNARFAVALKDANSKVELLSVERIEDAYQ